MPKQTRLTGSEIRRMTTEKRLNSSLFSISVGRSEEGTKVACVVSKKVANKAVERNRVKRRMREALRSLAPLPQGVALLIVAKKPAAAAPLGDIRADIAALMARLA